MTQALYAHMNKIKIRKKKEENQALMTKKKKKRNEGQRLMVVSCYGTGVFRRVIKLLSKDDTKVAPLQQGMRVTFLCTLAFTEYNFLLFGSGRIELRAWCFLGKPSATWATLQVFCF
jgi:hypothetical protein